MRWVARNVGVVNAEKQRGNNVHEQHLDYYTKLLAPRLAIDGEKSPTRHSTQSHVCQTCKALSLCRWRFATVRSLATGGGDNVRLLSHIFRVITGLANINGLYQILGIIFCLKTINNLVSVASFGSTK